MGLFDRRSRHGAAGRRALARRLAPAIDRLESRALLTVIEINGTANPRLLRPNQGQTVEVRLKGMVPTTSAEFPRVSYQVIDQYRRVQPSAKIKMELFAVAEKKDVYFYKYSATVSLTASANSSTKPGRTYYILVKASDRDNSKGKYFAVLVPVVPIHVKPAKVSTAQG